ncbi:hypothetical protein N7516_009097 [Penicillium verrucosum]|uniref:uncharacterized protein n=1 Tax=Penicillium verrucosum TaxID=60171 RepID=UPI00254521A9|nr:uncharacterized protein N7516_009097 [Penicillium verrucosum]KAJ5927324.1 hypothetical protein N7516_009097 [Penicillium verrucosum]
MSRFRDAALYEDSLLSTTDRILHYLLQLPANSAVSAPASALPWSIANGKRVPGTCSVEMVRRRRHSTSRFSMADATPPTSLLWPSNHSSISQQSVLVRNAPAGLCSVIDIVMRR